MFAGIFEQNFTYTISLKRKYYAYVVLGTGTINGYEFIEGDGFAIEQETQISITGPQNSEIILFDLPA